MTPNNIMTFQNDLFDIEDFSNNYRVIFHDMAIDNSEEEEEDRINVVLDQFNYCIKVWIG